MRIVQIAISCRDMLASRNWYTSCFGFMPAGGLDPDTFSEPLDIGAIQGIPGAQLKVVWAVDRQEFFQTEHFQYRAPEPRPLPAHWRVCDIGYTTIGVHIRDFDTTVDLLAQRGTRMLSEPVGAPRARRVCVQDPDGVIVEVMEDDPRVPGSGERPWLDLPSVTRLVRASVPDLAQASAFFVDVSRLRRHEPMLHGPEHERLWGLDGARRQVALFSGGDFWLELAEYEAPRPAPWPDGYRISDLGILNIALGTRRRDVYQATKDAVLAAGHRAHTESDNGSSCVTYVENDQGFSVELMYLDASIDAMAGFLPEPQR